MGNKICQSAKWRNSKTCWIFGVGLALLIIGHSLEACGQAGLPGLPMRGDGGRNTNQAGQVKVELVSQYEAAAPGQQFAIAVVLEVAKGWHMYPNPDLRESSYPTKILPYLSPYFRFGKVLYPTGGSYSDPLLKETYDVYHGQVIIYVPVEVLQVSTTERPGQTIIRFRLEGLTCDESKGACEPWEDEASIQIKLAPEQTESKPIQSELFAGFDVSKLDWEGAVVLPAQETANVDDTDTTAKSGQEYVMPDYQPREWEKQASSVWLILLTAIAAGILLNVMPCVLPVIPLKVLSLIQQSQSGAQTGDRFKAVKLSLVFSAGILLVFIALALVMSVFKLLYGQQFQSDAFKFVMLMIVFVMGLSMLGLFEIVLPGKVTNIQIVREGYIGALGMGVLATLLATPCSAPLLGSVLTWSLRKPTSVTVAVFLLVGIGMAAPYVILTAFPKWLHRIPKPGPWMIRLKQGLGFVMLGVAAYLIFLFQGPWQFWLILFCLILALATWLSWQVVNYSSSVNHKIWRSNVSNHST
jgi:thiol:disulfide interchange protein